MKNVILGLMALAALSGCGSDSSPSANQATIDGIADGQDVYTVRISGDNTRFFIGLFADLNTSDEEQLSAGPIVVGAGQTLEYTITAHVFHGLGDASTSGVTRSGGTDVGSGGNWMTITLYKNGVQQETAQLSSSGTSHTFQHYE